MTEEVPPIAVYCWSKESETPTASLSQLSTQEMSHKSSFDDLQDLHLPAFEPTLLRVMAFPTGKLCQQTTKPSRKAPSALYQSLSVSAASQAALNLSSLRQVLETLEEQLEPVDLRPRKAPIAVGLPSASTLLRTRKLR